MLKICASITVLGIAMFAAAAWYMSQQDIMALEIGTVYSNMLAAAMIEGGAVAISVVGATFTVRAWIYKHEQPRAIKAN